jgi:hypothetical protein
MATMLALLMSGIIIGYPPVVLLYEVSWTLANWFIISKRGMNTHSHDDDTISLILLIKYGKKKCLDFCSIFAVFQFRFKE